MKALNIRYILIHNSHSINEKSIEKIMIYKKNYNALLKISKDYNPLTP